MNKYTATDFIVETSFSMKSTDGKVVTIRDANMYNIYYITNEGDHIKFAENIETMEFCKLLDIINDLVPEYKEIYDN
jgi:hypothetical protein